ncbi:ABC transporter permease [Oceanobacillus manasiensis]|uniref:ABC transporter permease n=1 Tax=Oceanobacillus manasiensis TaxID=586413 RepID=UPI0018DE2EE1|nr:ABC transporter permease [Oceanobacillus manasiensis]
MRNVQLFVTNNVLQFKRKWLSLPLLLLFPVLLSGLVLFVILQFFINEEQAPVKVGIVDLDQSEETQLVSQLIEETPLSSFLELEGMEKQRANEMIEADELSTYIVIQQGFTENLYQGKSVDFPIIGNPNQPAQSQLVRELIDSVARHISAAQANILTINHYAKQLEIDGETRNDLLFENFKEYFFYTIGKDRIVNENQVNNAATSNPLNYYSLSLWFTFLTLWLFVIYNFLSKENTERLRQRMKLYGVTMLQQTIAKMIVTLTLTTFFSAIALFVFHTLLNWDLTIKDLGSILLISMLYGAQFLFILGFVDVCIFSHKLRLLTQSILSGLYLLISGAVIPTIYFPVSLQETLEYIAPVEALHWIQEIVLANRDYIDYFPLLLLTIASLFVFVGTALGKERLQE